jgi:hypothetical protein
LYKLGYDFITRNYQDASGILNGGTWQYDASTNTFFSFLHPYAANENLPSIVDMSVIDVAGNVLFDNVTDDPHFSLFNHVAQAAHYAAHNLLNSKDSIHDIRIQTFVDDVLENIPLTSRDLQALFLLIEEMRTEKYKKQVLLKYLDKVSSMNDAGLEQKTNQALEKLEANRVYEHPYLALPQTPMTLERTSDVQETPIFYPNKLEITNGQEDSPSQ